MGPATSVGTGTHWQVSVKLLLWLLGGGITALIVAFVLASISISGVQSMSAAMVVLCDSLRHFCFLLAGGRHPSDCESETGGKAALVTRFSVGRFLCRWTPGLGLDWPVWLVHQKAILTAARQLPPPSVPKPPTGQKYCPLPGHRFPAVRLAVRAALISTLNKAGRGTLPTRVLTLDLSM